MPFPRGFGFKADGKLFLSSGTGPDGKGDDTIVTFSGDPGKVERLEAALEQLTAELFKQKAIK